ncbi:MAG: autotransporter-associated beta strand repeat-containing protein [Phycisphaerae bacterium]
MMAVLPAAALLSAPTRAATDIWTGAGGADNTFRNAANWQGGVAPSVGDILIFDGNKNLTANNNFPAGTNFAGLQFAPTVAGPFNVTGFAINLNGNIADNTQSLTNTISLAGIGLVSNTTIDVVNTGTLAISSVLSGTGGINKTSAGTLVLSGTNTFTGPVTVGGGTLSIANDANLGAAPASFSASALTLNSGATLQTTANVTLDPNRGIRLPSGTANINTASGTALTYNGVISGSGGFSKTSFGTIILGGANTYTGPTSITNGILNLDFTQATAPAANIINSASALTLGGTNAGLGNTSYAEVIVNGAASVTSNQSFSSTTFNVGPNIIRANSGTGGTTNVNLGAITNNTGSVANFIAPASGHITTTSTNTNGMLGGWATVGTGATQNAVIQGNDFAAVDNTGNIVSLTSLGGYTTWTSGTIQGTGSNNFPTTANLQNTTGANLNVADDGAGITVDINSLELNNVVNNQAIAVGTGNTLRFGATGGILVNTNSTVTMFMGETGTTQHNVGVITAGGAPNTPGTLVVTVNSNSESSGAFRLGAVLADNGTGKLTFVKAGAGNIKIDGNNTFSGDSYILQGRAQMTGGENGGTVNPSAFGTGTIHVFPGAYVFPGSFTMTNNWELAGIGTNQESIGAIRMGNGTVITGNIALSGDARIGGGNSLATALTGVISGNHNLDLGAGTSVSSQFTISNPGNNWTGNTTIVSRTTGSGTTLIHLGASEVIPNGFGKGNLIFGLNSTPAGNTETLDLNGFNETVNGLLTGNGAAAAAGIITNNAASTAATLTVGDNDQTATFGGIIQNGNSAVGITKIGKGIQTLAGANTYTGNTTILAGTLNVTGSLSTAGSVFVATSNTTAGTLSGTGTVGNVVMNASNGTNVAAISPGATAGSLGTLTVSSLTVNGGRLDLDLSGGGASDQIVSSGPVTFNAASLLNPSAGAPAGSYTVLTAPSLTYTVAPTLNSPQNTRLTFSDTLSATSIIISVTGQVANLTWTGAGDHSTWDLNNTPNFTSTALSNPNVFFFGDNVTFDDSAAAGNQNITISQPMLAGNVTINSNNYTYSFVGSGGIGGGGGLTKSGTGTVVLGTANSYAAGTTLNAGTMDINTNSAIGTGSFTINGGTLDNTSGANITLGTNNSQVWAADFAFAGTGNLGLGTGAVTLLNGTRTINVANNTLSVGGAISDNGAGFGLTKTGNGTLGLSGNNTFSGNTNINAGTVKVGSLSPFGTNASAQVNIASGAALDVGGFATATTAANAGGIVQQINVSGTGVGGTGAILNSSNLSQQTILQNVNLTGDASFGGIGRFDLRSANAGSVTATLALNGHTLTKIGTGQFSVVDANVGAGNIVVNGGTLSIESGTNVGAGTAITYNDGTTAQFFANTGTVSAPMTVNGNVTMGNADNANNATIDSNISLNSSAVLIFGPVNNGGGNGNLTLNGHIAETDPAHPASILKTSTGTVALSTPNTYSGGTTINGGAISFNSLNNFGNGSLTFGGGGVAYNGNTDDISTRSVTINAGGAAIDTSFAAGTVTFANPIGNNGAGGIIKNGFNDLVLAAANTFTGPSAINSGALIIGNAAALPASGALAINSDPIAGTSGTLDLNGFNVQVGPLSGGGQIRDNGSGSTTTTLTVNTVAATATTFSGTILNGNAHSVALAVSGPGTLALTGGGFYVGGTTVKNGATLQVGTTNTVGTGGVTLNNGTFQYLASVGNNSDNHAFSLTGNNTLITDSGVTLTTFGAISGSGGLAKGGAGSLTLSGTQTYTGNTTVNAGTLVLNTNLSTAGTVTVNPGATLSGAATLGSLSVSAANGTNVATIAPGSNPIPGTIGTLTTSGLTVAGGNFLFDIGGGVADQINSTGAASFTGPSTFSLVPTSGVSSGNYTLVSASSLALGTMPTFILVEPTGNISFSAGANGTASFGRSTFKIDLLTANQIRLDVNAPGAASLTWTGAVNSIWDVTNPDGSVTGTANWSGSNTTFVNLDNVTFNDTASNTNVTINTTVVPGSVTFSNSSKNYTLSGTGGIAGATTVTLNGTGLVAIGNANSYTGGTSVLSGTLAINNANALGNGTLTIAGGALDNTSGADVALANVPSVLINSNLNFLGHGNLSLGAAAVTLNTTPTINVANNTLTFAGVVSGGGGITKTGNGTLALNSANTYTGNTNINGGVIIVGNLSALGTNTSGVTINGGTLDFGNIPTANAAAGTISQNPVTIAGDGAGGLGAIVNTGANNQQNALQNVTLSANASFGGTTRFDIRAGQSAATTGNVANVAKLSLNGNTLTKNGSNQVSLQNVDINSGNIIVNAGTNANGVLSGILSLESNTSTGTQDGVTPNTSGNITLNTGAILAFFQNPGLAASAAASANATTPTEISAITWPMTFNGNNTIGNGGGTAIIDSNATLNGNITFEAITATLPSLTANNPLRWAGTLSGTGSVTKLGAASLVLQSNANSYSGGTAIDGGILQFSNLSQLGTGGISFAGGTLQYNGNTDDISTRTITINGANANASINGQNGIALAGGATIDTNGQNVTFANPIGNGGAGGLTKAGNGTLTVNGANSWTGNTTVTAGALNVPSGATIATATGNVISTAANTTLSVASGATISASPDLTNNGNTTLANTADTFGALAGSGNLALTPAAITVTNGGNYLGVISGTGSLTVNGPAASTLTLSGANSYSGGTTVSGGVLSVGASNNLGNTSGALTVNGGTIQITGTTLNAFTRTFNWGANNSGIDIHDAGNTFTLNQNISGGGLTKSGAGTLVITGNYTSTNPTVVSAGTLTLSGPANSAAGISGTGALVVSAGTTAAPGLTSDGISGGIALTVNGAAKIRTNGTATGTSLLSALSFGSANNTLDITNNKLILQATPATKATSLANLQTQVSSHQLIDSVIPTGFAMAVIDNAATNLTTFGGINVDANSLLVSQELTGDANVDGKVDLTDLSAVLNNFGVTTSLWTKGNFDGSATINLTDLSDVLNHFGLTNPSAAFAPGEMAQASGGGNIAATPEPASLAILMSASALLATRRRQRRTA